MDSIHNPYEMVIVVRETRRFTEVELTHAVARAVVKFLPSEEAMSSSWRAWLDGFRKLLRHASGARFDGLPAKLDEAGVAYSHSSEGEVELIVVEPLRKSVTRELFRQTHIQGLKLQERSGPLPVSSLYGRAEVAVNSTLAMSPAKAAVAAAHALQLLRAHVEREGTPADRAWLDTYPVSVVWRPLTPDDEAGICVRDAGHTEVTPGSLTAAVRLKGGPFLR